MFNVGFPELMLVLLVAFVIVGPKDLPKVARSIGKTVRTVREMFEDFKKETGLDEAAEDFKDTQRDLSTTMSEIDPRVELKSAERAINTAVGDIKKVVTPKKPLGR